MQIIINSYNPTPIYEQIAEQIEAQILNGTVPAETALPSIRALANELKVSVITTKKAYEVLEQRGWVIMIPQRETLVRPMKNDVLKKRAEDEIRKRYRALLEYAGNAGYTNDELHELLKKEESSYDRR